MPPVRHRHPQRRRIPGPHLDKPVPYQDAKSVIQCLSPFFLILNLLAIVLLLGTMAGDNDGSGMYDDDSDDKKKEKQHPENWQPLAYSRSEKLMEERTNNQRDEGNNLVLSPKKDDQVLLKAWSLEPDRVHSKEGDFYIDIMKDYLPTDMDEKTRDMLSTLNHTELVSMYTSSARILGLENCEEIRDLFSSSRKVIAGGGLLSSGVTQFVNFMATSCPSQRFRTARTKELPWNLHDFVSEYTETLTRRKENKNSKMKCDVRGKERCDAYVPVIVVKDPYTWMNSVCPVIHGNLRWMRDLAHCPNLVPNEVDVNHGWVDSMDDDFYAVNGIPVIRDKGLSSVTHKSLVDVWNKFHREAVIANSTRKRLIIRHEDIIFRKKEVINSLCQCLDPNSKFVQKKRKYPEVFIELMKKYSSSKTRTEKFTEKDLEFVKEHLDEELMNLFGYNYP